MNIEIVFKTSKSIFDAGCQRTSARERSRVI
jgi:hypothetical protein